jgi:hypothetical protein
VRNNSLFVEMGSCEHFFAWMALSGHPPNIHLSSHFTVINNNLCYNNGLQIEDPSYSARIRTIVGLKPHMANSS